MTIVNINKTKDGQLNTSNSSDSAKSLAKEIRSQISPTMTHLIVKELGNGILIEHSEDGRSYKQLNAEGAIYNLCERYLGALFCKSSNGPSIPHQITMSSHPLRVCQPSRVDRPLGASNSASPRSVYSYSSHESHQSRASSNFPLDHEVDIIAAPFRQLATKNKELEQQRERNELIIQELRRFVRSTEAQRDSFKNQLENSQEQLFRLQTGLTQKNYLLSKRNDTLKSTLQAKEEEFESTRNTLEEALRQAEIEKDELTQTTEELQAELTEARSNHSQATEQLESAIQETTTNLEKSELRVQQTEAQLQLITERHAKEKDQLVSKLERNTSQIDENNTRLEELTHSVEELTVQRDKATARANQLAEALQQAEARSTSLSQENQELRAQLQSSQEQHKESQRVQATASTQIREQQEQIAKMQQEMQALREQNSTLQERVTTLISKNEQASIQLENETRKLSAAGIRIADLVRDYETINKHLDWHKTEINILKRKINERQSALEKSKEDTMNLQMSNTYYKDKLQRTIAQHEDEVERLENQVSQLQTLSNFHGRNYEDALHQIEELNEQLTLERNKVFRREQDLEELTYEYVYELSRQKDGSLLPLENTELSSDSFSDEELEALFKELEDAAPADADAAS